MHAIMLARPSEERVTRPPAARMRGAGGRGLAFALSVLLACAAGGPATTAQEQPGAVDARARFALESPDSPGALVVAPETRVRSLPSEVRIHVLEPVATTITYGAIDTRVNGEAAGTVTGIRGSTRGKIAIIDLTKAPHVRMAPGRNVVEIQGIDKAGRTHYASFVLHVAPTIQIAKAASGQDRQPPEVDLVEPRGDVVVRSGAAVSVRGFAVDGESSIVSIAINGRPAAIRPAEAARSIVLSKEPGAGRGAVAFEGSARPRPGDTTLVIEAKDSAGNVARVSIPLRHVPARPAERFTGRKYALVVGISTYKFREGSLRDLNYADDDARAFRDFLIRPEGGGFRAEDIVFLENERATAAAIRSALTSFLPKAGPNDLVVIYIAGHGAPDPFAPSTLYFIAHDTRVTDMPGTGVPMREVAEVVSNEVRAERVVVLVDTCRSAGLGGEGLVQSRGAENNLVHLYAEALFRGRGRAVLTSSDVTEQSFESERWGGGHGIFTLALLQGLRGAADSNGDGLISTAELFPFVRDRVSTETRFAQNPRVVEGEHADLVLAVAPRPARGKQPAR